MNLIYKIKLSPGANIDLKEALSYYSQISNDISRKFLKDFEQNVLRIQYNPQLFPKKIGEFRTVPMKQFPFILCYFINQFEKEIHVLALFNTHQNPDKLLERLK